MTEKRKLVLVGGGGTSADVLALIASINRETDRYEVLGLLDDALPAGSMRYGVPVLGSLSEGAKLADVRFVDCLGSPGSYQRREAILQSKGFDFDRFETVAHQSVFIAEDAIIGPGCILYPNVVILAGVTLGAHVTVLSSSVMNHEVSVGDFSIITSGVNLSGRVSIGRAVYIGSGSSVREGMSIGNGALIGLGSAVVRDVPPGRVVAGNPAKELRASA